MWTYVDLVWYLVCRFIFIAQTSASVDLRLISLYLESILLIPSQIAHPGNHSNDVCHASLKHNIVQLSGKLKYIKQQMQNWTQLRSWLARKAYVELFGWILMFRSFAIVFHFLDHFYFGKFRCLLWKPTEKSLHKRMQGLPDAKKEPRMGR